MIRDIYLTCVVSHRINKPMSAALARVNQLLHPRLGSNGGYTVEKIWIEIHV